MSTSIPAGLRSADIARFAIRAAQVERVKPVIAYWCNFWIVNQIIEKGLHTTDEEVKQYTTKLVDKLEQFKSEHSDNDALLDADAASAYVEEFGLEVFSRAETTMNANRVTRQTADTFQAAATFLELGQIWKPLDVETAARVKFSKYNAVRIMKAIKAGEDPNATNPAPKTQETSPEAELGLDPTAQVSGRSTPVPQTATQRQPFVEDVSEESQPPSSSIQLPQVPTGQTNVPTGEQGMDSLDLPSAPAFDTSIPPSVPNLPDTPSGSNLGMPPRPPPSNPFQAFQSFPPPSTISPPSPTIPSQNDDLNSYYTRPTNATATPPEFVTAGSRNSTPPQPVPAPIHTPAPAHIPAQPIAPQMPAPAPAPGLDDNSMTQAHKHARWAVSALTFDDVNTAVKELRTSLRYLGAE